MDMRASGDACRHDEQSLQIPTESLLQTIKFSCVILLLSAISQDSTAQTGAVRMDVDGQTVLGQPLAFDGKQLAILLRDGRLKTHQVQPENIMRTDRRLEPFTIDELHRAYFEEYRDRYDVSKTDHYVVVHPWGSELTWSRPFEDFHSRFVSYFESKGMELKEPEYPLVAMVLRSRNDFERSLINEVRSRDSRIAGYYSRITNRITTYDPAARLRDEKDRWIYSSWAIRHESTHQSAYNTGIHNRFAPPPTWLSEGIATMFEARGINDHERFKKPSDRVNVRRLKQLRKYLNTSDFHDGLVNLIANDRMFQTHQELAYGISWGLAFYLSEVQPDKFFAFIARDAKRRNFVAYTPQQRLKDFAGAFGDDFEKLASDLRRYYRVKK